MSLPISWSPAARDEFADLLQYIENRFGLDAALALLDKTDSALDGMSEFPEMFPESGVKKGIRKGVITKQTSVLYLITATEVQLLHFWDNRQNPGRMRDLVK